MSGIDRGLAGAIVQSLPHPVLVCGTGNAIVAVNGAAEVFFQVSASVLCRQKLDDLIAFGSPILGVVARVIDRHAPASEYRVPVATIRESTQRMVDVFGTPLAGEEGLVTLVLQERTMADKVDRQLVSRGAARSVNGLASMLAHEIKNPLSGIRGAAQLLEQSSTGNDRALARLVRDETDRIVALVDRVDVFGDDRPIEGVPLNIHVILKRVRLLAQSGLAPDVTFEEIYDPSLPPVLGDRDQLIQVFLNLIKNAAEAVAGQHNPEIRLKTAFRPGIRFAVAGVPERVSLPLEIIVEDNGPGVPSEIIAHLFDPFVTTKPTGSGLGLALVAKMIGDHGGVVECDSVAGRTRFRILLPVATGAELPYDA
jgi:two-component system, NtrC family, nitrogen regulation sensor histidine kinase GlnL